MKSIDVLNDWAWLFDRNWFTWLTVCAKVNGECQEYYDTHATATTRMREAKQTTSPHKFKARIGLTQSLCIRFCRCRWLCLPSPFTFIWFQYAYAVAYSLLCFFFGIWFFFLRIFGIYGFCYWFDSVCGCVRPSFVACPLFLDFYIISHFDCIS